MSPNNERVRKRSQASEPAGTPPADPKKVRRSVRVRGTTVDEAPSSPPPQNVPNAQASSEDLLAPISPPARSEIRHTPVASPPPQSNDTQISTQVASQFAYIPPQDDEEYDPNVWGYLDPINSTSYKSIRLNKNPQEPVEKKRGRGASRKTGPRGFLIGRHAECDLQIDSGVISNRHCVIYKEISSTVPKAVLEDLSSNGTWVNSIIVGRNRIRDLATGDEIEFAGGHKYHFRYPPSVFVDGFHDTFELGRPLGSGHFATVYIAVEKTTGIQFAVKVFKKRRSQPSDSQGLKQEIAMLMTLSHPNVLGLKGTYDEENEVYLVLELAPEGELFNYIIKHQKLSESDTRKIFKQLLNGLKHLHDRNVVHRDIKPENILLVDKNLTVKLADFGLSKIIGEDSFTTSLCGTPSYVAPEILASSSERQYTRAVDIWSLGVVLYICLCGFPPFSDELCTAENPYPLTQQIKEGIYDFPSPYWDSVGDPALDLIEKMLQVDPEKRITVDEAIRHPWITQPSFDPADSCGSLAARIAGLEFVRRRVYLERTLLAQAPGLANPASQNPSKVQIHQEKKAKPDKVDAETKAFINVGGKAGDETLYGESFYEVSHGGDDDGSD